MTHSQHTPAASGSSTRGRRGTAVAVATVFALLVAALVFFLASRGEDGQPAASAPAVAKHTKPTGYHVVVRSLHIDAPIVTIAMSKDRVLTPPANPRDVGWWNASAKPGAKGGQTVITGHTVHTGGGQFDHLGNLKKGATIDIVRHKVTRHYVATKVFSLSKQQVSDRAQQLFGQGRHRNRLVLITCGNWTGRAYLTNVFVYAKPVGQSLTADGTSA